MSGNGRSDVFVAIPGSLEQALLARAIVQSRSGKGVLVRVKTVGLCMEPLIRAGDSVCVAAVVHALQVGDIVVFHNRQRIVAHRVIAVRGERNARQILCKGDNAAWPDHWIQESSIIGVVLAVQSQSHYIPLNRWFWMATKAALAQLSIVKGWCIRRRPRHRSGTAVLERAVGRLHVLIVWAGSALVRMRGEFTG